MMAVVRAGLARAYDGRLVDELLAAYSEAKRNFYLGGLRLAEVEGGRFCEAAFRMLEEAATGSFTPLGQQIDSDGVIRRLLALPKSQGDSVRQHIPRALRMVYDIRNKRDAAHLADGIDPNVQDATLVASVLDWVLAEFVRLHHSVSADEAQRIVNGLVTRRVPVIQEFDGFLKVLNPQLPASDHVLLLLYHRGGAGATFEELLAWSRPEMRSNLRRTLDRLANGRAAIHFGASRYYITEAGSRYVEVQRLFDVPS